MLIFAAWCSAPLFFPCVRGKAKAHDENWSCSSSPAELSVGGHLCLHRIPLKSSSPRLCPHSSLCSANITTPLYWCCNFHIRFYEENAGRAKMWNLHYSQSAAHCCVCLKDSSGELRTLVLNTFTISALPQGLFWCPALHSLLDRHHVEPPFFRKRKDSEESYLILVDLSFSTQGQVVQKQEAFP